MSGAAPSVELASQDPRRDRAAGRPREHDAERPFEDLTGADALRRLEHVWTALDGAVFEADATSGDFVSVSDGIRRALDIAAADWVVPGFWVRHLHPDDRAAARHARQGAIAATGPYVIAYRLVGEAGRIAHVREIGIAHATVRACCA